jgi:hypothetical protein
VCAFYKTFWEKSKEPVIEMFGEFFRVEFNISRLNYGMISLITKLKEANNMKAGFLSGGGDQSSAHEGVSFFLKLGDIESILRWSSGSSNTMSIFPLVS